RYARSVTAVDASPRMNELSRSRINNPKITYITSDIFDWKPDRIYDAVFFGFWLSHIPPARFESFWDLVRRTLAANGRVAFVDEDDRGADNDDRAVIDGVPSAQRRLGDGLVFDIVKVFWRPDDLESELKRLGWEVGIRRVGETFMFGAGRALH
ncbi:MAG: class I SAM-dependent methyltransferase, partial [Acidimicrobiia bacterium]